MRLDPSAPTLDAISELPKMRMIANTIEPLAKARKRASDTCSAIQTARKLIRLTIKLGVECVILRTTFWLFSLSSLAKASASRLVVAWIKGMSGQKRFDNGSKTK